MPVAHIYLLEGRTEEQKKKLIEAVTDAMVETIGAKREGVRIILEEMKKEHFAIGGVTAKDLGR